MGTFFVFLGILLLSQFVALLAGLQLADHFRATEEFIAVMMAIIVFALVAIVAFAIAYVFARTTRPLRSVAMTLVLVVLVLLALPKMIPWLYEPKVNPLRITTKEVPVLLELLVPALILILVQWGLVRRRWLRRRGPVVLALGHHRARRVDRAQSDWAGDRVVGVARGGQRAAGHQANDGDRGRRNLRRDGLHRDLRQGAHAAPPDHGLSVKVRRMSDHARTFEPAG
jgi:hypothetical protein